MRPKLVIEPEAEAELEEAAERYEDSVTGLGLEFLAEMRQRTQAPAEGSLMLAKAQEAQARKAH